MSTISFFIWSEMVLSLLIYSYSKRIIIHLRQIWEEMHLFILSHTLLLCAFVISALSLCSLFSLASRIRIYRQILCNFSEILNNFEADKNKMYEKCEIRKSMHCWTLSMCIYFYYVLLFFHQLIIIYFISFIFFCSFSLSLPFSFSLLLSKLFVNSTFWGIR